MKTILCFFLMLFSTVCFGQKDSIKSPEMLWTKVNSAFYNKLMDSLHTYYDTKKNDPLLLELIKKEELKSLDICNQLIREFPNSELLSDALYKKAFITYEYLDADSAKENFLKVVNLKTKRGGYKRQACLMLASIEIDKKNYEQAIFYLDETSKYKLTLFCGTAWNYETERLRNMYTLCFNGIKK